MWRCKIKKAYPIKNKIIWKGDIFKLSEKAMLKQGYAFWVRHKCCQKGYTWVSPYIFGLCVCNSFQWAANQNGEHGHSLLKNYASARIDAYLVLNDGDALDGRPLGLLEVGCRWRERKEADDAPMLDMRCSAACLLICTAWNRKPVLIWDTTIQNQLWGVRFLLHASREVCTGVNSCWG